VTAADDFTRVRMGGQLACITALMADGEWRTLREIARATGAPAPSVSAQLRHLRKPQYGASVVKRRSTGGMDAFEYRVTLSDAARAALNDLAARASPRTRRLQSIARAGCAS
jgi:hypothetical protein